MGGSESRVARYSIEHREWVVRQMMPPLNRTVPELVEATGITDATLYAWRKQARAAGAVVPGDGQQADQWSSQDKFRVVLESASLNAAELAEYCRRKGLYVEQINAWREACEQANSLAQPSKTRREREVRIPRHPATQSALIWPGIPRPSGHLFHGHPAGQSERSDAGVALLV